MTPGTFIFDMDFKFHDGEDGKKILVVLGTSQGITVAVKTTSQGHRYLNDFGCQTKHRFPNFHLVSNCCCLTKPTWICLNEFYEFNDGELLKKHFSGKVNRIGMLTKEITVMLCECALGSDDISGKQTTILQEAYQKYLKETN